MKNRKGYVLALVVVLLMMNSYRYVFSKKAGANLNSEVLVGESGVTDISAYSVVMENVLNFSQYPVHRNPFDFSSLKPVESVAEESIPVVAEKPKEAVIAKIKREEVVPEVKLIAFSQYGNAAVAILNYNGEEVVVREGQALGDFVVEKLYKNKIVLGEGYENSKK